MDDNNGDMVTKTDSSNLARGIKEGFKTTKPTIMLKYPESINFSTTCMIKELTMQIGMTYENQKKFLFTYGIGEVLIEDGGQGYLVPGVNYALEVTLNKPSMDLLEKQGFEIKYDSNKCTLVYMFNNKETQNFDEDRMRTMQNKAAPQRNKNILDESTRNVEDKDINCLMSHQWDFGETGAPIRKTAVPKGKETLEHFGVKLEDAKEGKDTQEQPILTHSTRNPNLQGILPTRPSTSRMIGSEDSSSSKSDDFTIIT
nr:ARID DNA-binding domain-containing protein [Tanacetum cinerariifolium]